MKEKSRTYNSVINSLFGISASAVTVLLNFFVRIVLVQQLGAEINGLHTLFQSIINIMTIMEMGISSAMVIHLYKPIKNKEVDSIKGIISFYKKVYFIIALLFGIATVFVDVFLLDTLVTTTIQMQTVRFYFLLFGACSVVNYLTYYRRSILYAEQKNRISILSNAVCELLFRSLQIITIFWLHNYTIFLLLWILEKLSSNLICNYYVNKNHPYLKYNKAQLVKEKKRAIFNTIKPLMVNQLAGTARQSSKSILSSILLGNVSIVGFYGNYQLVISMVELIFSQFGGAITSSFGNLAVERDSLRMQQAYKKASFVMDWVACYMCAGFLVCIQDFISMAFGKESVLDILSVFSLLANLVFYLLTVPIISIQNAMGLHRLDAISMVVQAIASIVMGYVGGLFLGMPGIFFGILIPLVLFTFIRKGIIISKFALEMTWVQYFKFIGYEILKIIMSIALTVLVCIRINLDRPLLNILLRGAVTIVVCTIIPWFMSLKSNELIFVKRMIRSRITKA